MKKSLLLVAVLLGFVFNSNAQVVEDFESWNPYSIGLIGAVQMTEPTGWTGSDSFIVGYGKLLNPLGAFQAQVFQDNPGQAGTGALRVATKFQAAINAGTVSLPAKDYPCICTNSQITLDVINGGFSQSGGTSIFATPVATSMYVKNTTVMGDSTFITALLIDNSDGGDSIIAVADTTLSANINAYTKLTLPFTYLINNMTGTLVRYTISSGNPLAFLDSTNTFSVHSGTEIIVDNIDLDFPSGIRQLINAKQVAKVYPTIVSDVLYVDLIDNLKEARVDIYCLNGQLVSSNPVKVKNNTIDISKLPSGSYIYGIKSQDVIYQTGKFVK